MVITHRRRLVEALHVPLREALPCLVAQVEGALRGGADLVYLREPDLSVREVMSVVTAVLDRLPDAHHRLVVRDRVDVAASLGVGVHLPEQGMAVGPARVQLERGTAPVVVGRSVHTALSAANSRGARYLVAGTVKPTDSKPGLTQPLGLHGLREICTAAEGIPVLGVGGLGTEDIEDLRRSGAQGLAAIGLFIPIRICTDVTAWTIERLKDVRKCIDLVE
jgi:thiamine-phosphate diphosphorylase